MPDTLSAVLGPLDELHQQRRESLAAVVGGGPYDDGAGLAGHAAGTLSP